MLTNAYQTVLRRKGDVFQQRYTLAFPFKMKWLLKALWIWPQGSGGEVCRARLRWWREDTWKQDNKRENSSAVYNILLHVYYLLLVDSRTGIQTEFYLEINQWLNHEIGQSTNLVERERVQKKSSTPPPFLSLSRSLPLSSLSSNGHPWEDGPPGNHGYGDWVPLVSTHSRTCTLTHKYIL